MTQAVPGSRLVVRILERGIYMSAFNFNCLTLHSHGGSKGVTGSAHELILNSKESLLVDCGLFQGADRDEGEKSWKIDFDISKIKVLLVTHCHIDHVGRIPALLVSGLDGPIYCTKATALLLPVVIKDALKVGVTKNERLIQAVLGRLKSQIIAVDYKKWVTLSIFDTKPQQSINIKFKSAGHIIGSAYIELSINSATDKTNVVFSGDLGAPYTPLLAAPKSPYRCDWLIMESTYGGKQHHHRNQRIKSLKAVVEKSLRDGGVILIPAFSIGRTQELLYELEEILHRTKRDKNSKWKTLPIIVDSPLAAKFTTLYRQLKPLWDKEAKRKIKAGRHPLNFDNLITIDDHSSHLALISRLVSSGEPAIVIAASGMCSGGRIVNYLSALLPKKETDILFVGYQAKGTPGRDIQQYGPDNGYVYLDDHKVEINAKIHTLSGYSAHADQSDLINFVKRMHHKPKQINLIHGETSAKESLKVALNKVVTSDVFFE